MRTSNRQIIYKLYDVDNNFIRVLDDVASHFNTEKNLFSGSAPLTLTFATRVDELSDDLTFNNKIKIYVRNKWSSDLRLVYYGYIVSIDPVYSAGNEQTGVTCLGNISKLQNDFLRIDDNDLAYEIAPKSVGDHIREIIEHYQTTLDDKHGSTDRSMLEDPGSYWSDTDYIENTNTIGLIPHRYFNSKHLDAVNEIGKFLPKNDAMNQYWYWYLTDEGKLVLKKLSTTADHTLTIGKHCTFAMRNNIESVINRVYFWNERGDYAGEKIRTKYEDTSSQDQYDVIADRITDTQVTTHTQGRLLAEGSLMDRKDNQHQSTVTVSESQYDILTFKPGQVVKLQNVKDEDMFADRMIITKILLQTDSVVLSLSTPRPDLTTQVETDREFVDKQLRWFGEILTRIDGSRIYTGVQHWVTEDIVFGTDGNDKITWTAGSFNLSNDVKRVIAAGELASMDIAKQYYVYLDEENNWSTKDTGVAAVTSGTGEIREGENFLVDSGASWTTDEYKGHVLWVNPAVGAAQKYIISRNTTTVLYLDGYSVFRETDSNASYEVHKFVLRPSWKTSAEGSADSGSTTALVDSSLDEGNDHWNGFKLKILSGSNAGMIRTVTSFTSNTLSFPALPHSVSATDQYSLYLGAETQVLIAMATPEPETEGEATVTPQIPAVNPPYQSRGATRAYQSIDEYMHFIKDVVNEKLDTSSKNILADFNFGSVNYAGAVKAGDIAWNTSTGVITGGSGVAIYRSGIVGAKAGVATFSINTDGDAYFKGELAAGSIVSAEIDAGQITTGVLNAARVTVGSTSTFGSGYDPTTKFPTTSAGALAYLDLVQTAQLGTTVISGGWIHTDLLTADNIKAGVLEGRRVQTGSSGTRIMLGEHGHSSWPDQVVFYDLHGTAAGAMRGTVGDITVSGGLHLDDFTMFEMSVLGYTQVYFDTTNGQYWFNGPVLPWANASRDLGSTSYKWRDIHCSRYIYENSKRVAKIHVGSSAPPENHDSWLWVDTS